MLPVSIREKRDRAFGMYNYQIIYMAKKSSIPGLSFSWKRALGITKVKQQISRKAGIPMTKAGVERKIGNAVLKALLGK